MTRRTVVVALVGLALVGAVTACGGGSQKLYDAKATYKCLHDRPDYRPPSYNWYPGMQGVSPPPALAFQVLAPAPGFRNQGNFPYKGSNIGPSWNFSVVSVRAFAFAAHVVIFDKIDSARATYRIVLRGADPALLTEARRENEVTRNVFIDWATGDQAAPKSVRSIVLGCLRTA